MRERSRCEGGAVLPPHGWNFILGVDTFFMRLFISNQSKLDGATNLALSPYALDAWQAAADFLNGSPHVPATARMWIQWPNNAEACAQ